jgi:co-chaperonin GroES (HSP10)
MRAVNDYILIEKIKQAERKVNGLLLTEDLDKEVRYARAKVISIGGLVQGINEQEVVCYDKHAGSGIEWKGKLYHVIRMRDVVFVE